MKQQKQTKTIPIKYKEFKVELDNLAYKYGIELYVMFHTETRFLTKKKDVLVTAYSSDNFDDLITNALHKRFLDRLKENLKRGKWKKEKS